MSASVQSKWKTKVSEAIEIPIVTKCCFCVPLRKGLVATAYVNLILNAVIACIWCFFIWHGVIKLDASLYKIIIVEESATCLDVIMNVMFIVGLHRKNALIMKIYMYYAIISAIVNAIYVAVFSAWENGSEVFILIGQIFLQMYLSILVYNSIVKMERDGTVNYTRERGVV